jgi:uncharacterized lipoprotein YddW (UPF0748 family)
MQSTLQQFRRWLSLFQSRPSGRVKLDQRGVWLTYTDSSVLTSQADLKTAIQRLADLGLNTLYPCIWQRGHTLYPSAVAAEVTGSAVLPHSPFQGRDLLAELLPLAQANGLRVIPWLEYGLMVPPNAAIAQQHPTWLTQTASGERLHNGMVWLNPTHPDVISFFVNLVSELVQRYEPDGIQWDDHFGFPVELGYDDWTTAQYRQATGDNPPVQATDRDWMLWRSQRLTELLQQICQAVHTHQPQCWVSLSPNPYSFSFNRYLADWPQWIEAGLIDELVVQLYRDQISSLIAELNKPELLAARSRIPVSIGLLAGIRTKPVPLSRLQEQVAAVQQQGFIGVSFFFYETLLHQTLSPKATGDRDLAQLKRLLAWIIHENFGEL